MTETPTTPFSNKADILAEFWIDYKNDTQFEDFITYNDLGLPLAYAVSVGIVESTALSDNFINETFEMFLEILSLKDTGWEDLGEILAANAESQT